MEQGGKRLGEILIDAELITKEQLNEALVIQKKEYKPLGEILIDLNYVGESQLYKTLEYFFQVPYIDLMEITPEPSALELVSEVMALKHIFIPIYATKKSITVVMKDPLDYEAIDDIKLLTNREVKIAIAPMRDIKNSIDRYYSCLLYTSPSPR